MSRPEFPLGTALTVGAIDAIKEAQAEYDRDPEGYERREEQAREEQRLQEEEERAWLQYEREQDPGE